MTKDTSKIILVIGALALAYYVLKSWGIIGPLSMNNNKSLKNNNQFLNWTPLTNEQINQLRILIDNPINIVRRT